MHPCKLLVSVFMDYIWTKTHHQLTYNDYADKDFRYKTHICIRSMQSACTLLLETLGLQNKKGFASAAV